MLFNACICSKCCVRIPSLNSNRRDCYKILLRKCIKCDCVTYMRTKTLAGAAGSGCWCARGPQIGTRGSHHIISHPISRQIGFSGFGVRVC